MIRTKADLFDYLDKELKSSKTDFITILKKDIYDIVDSYKRDEIIIDRVRLFPDTTLLNNYYNIEGD